MGDLTKRAVLLAALALLVTVSAKAHTMKNDNHLDKRIIEIEDRLALKELVDKFSILADRKDVRAQTQLFTANGMVETYSKGVLVAKLNGRKEMESTFASFLSNFETVYHFNGQQTVTIKGDKASGVSYCMVTLIGVENGKKMKTSIGVYYQDEYVCEKSLWLIAKRRSVFDWQDKRELGE